MTPKSPSLLESSFCSVFKWKGSSGPAVSSGKPGISEDSHGSGGEETSLGRLALSLPCRPPWHGDALWRPPLRPWCVFCSPSVLSGRHLIFHSCGTAHLRYRLARARGRSTEQETASSETLATVAPTSPGRLHRQKVPTSHLCPLRLL